MKIGLYWYKKDHASLWTYDLTNHMMVDLEIIIKLFLVTFVEEKNLYELHPMDEKVLNDFTYYIKVLLYCKISSLCFRPCFSLYTYVFCFLNLL